MDSAHRIHVGDASEMAAVDDDAVDLVVTSPPYPMIEMWDEQFAAQSDAVAAALDDTDGERAFAAMHALLDEVWSELQRVLTPGGVAAIIVGDATRSLGDHFRVYQNHARVIEAFDSLGFDPLPEVLWRKPTNSAAKFMGSGMVPPNAYVTLEHEYVLLFRNGTSGRSFEPGETRRYESAYFWEERNRWFSDVWTDVRGARQARNEDRDAASARLGGSDGDVEAPRASDADRAAGERDRTAAYPFEIPYRLVCMYSLYGDTVLDPFLGTGTTTLAAMVAGRNSIGYELDADVLSELDERVGQVRDRSRRVVEDRLAAHRAFVEAQRAEGTVFEYEAEHYDFPVRTRQEREIKFRVIDAVSETDDGYRVRHEQI
ncbi:site-specific DNA-methyltransferase [Halobellus sp. Atlit-38R]|uniref:DNA-methyltransferase n=1 Tax=Halobellus sp. Atlit-38R TaxID=2282131 RepID=UPI000EF17B63|nr:site-specific DNA-methyltransferase [Halobellus sp. Atlit-38R]RLM89853.1 site-specific DNA-methyltransferase [Halobellus sp. Atlit-38R]